MLKVNVRDIFTVVVAGANQAYSALYQAAVSAPDTVRIVSGYARYIHRVFWVTPIEYEERGWEEAETGGGISSIRWVLSPLGRGNMQRQLVLPLVPSGCVRVELYTRLDNIYEDSSVWIDVPILPSGGLDLSPIKQKYGLENCTPIDPVHCKLFRLQIKEVLSPLALCVLTDGQPYLRVIELPSKELRFARGLRLRTQRAIKRTRQALYEGLHTVVAFLSLVVLFFLTFLLFLFSSIYHKAVEGARRCASLIQRIVGGTISLLQTAATTHTSLVTRYGWETLRPPVALFLAGCALWYIAYCAMLWSSRRVVLYLGTVAGPFAFSDSGI